MTFAGRENVLTPTHTGAQPASYTVDGRTVRPLGDENDKAFALINALNAEQQKQAILGFEVRNLVLGPGADGKMIAPEGVRASTFTPAQRTMLLELAREWVGILGDEAAAAKMKEIQSGIADTYFAWAGPTTDGKGAYFRIQGPAVFIEYAPQGAGDNNIDHIHTIYRDPTNDYAARMTQAVRGTFAATAVFVLVLSASPSAHRLDEYLQAARVSLAHTRVALEIDLTPGASVADGIIALIDRDGDSRISPLEAESYGRDVLADVVLELDGRPIALTLYRVEVPSLDEMRHGLGAIQLRASGDVEPRMSLRRELHFQNNHQAGSSVYLVNALIPSDDGISVVSQTRDAKQRDVRIEYSVQPAVAQVSVLAGSWVGGWWLVVHEVARLHQPLTTNH